MNYLFLTHIYPPAIDGGSKIIYKLADYLSHRQNVTILTTNCSSSDDFINPKYKRLSLRSRNRTVFHLDICPRISLFFRYLHKIVKIDIFKNIGHGPIFNPFQFLKFVRYITSLKPDWIIAGPLPTTIYLYAFILKKIFNSKILFLPCFHQADSSFNTYDIGFILRRCHLIWTLSQVEKTYLTRHFNLLSSNVINFGAGVDKSFVKKSRKNINGNLHLLFLGNFSSHKNIELLIKIFPSILSKYPKAHLTIAGQKTLYYPKILEIYNHLSTKIKKKIKLIPQRYSSSQQKKLLDSCHILVNLSSQESFGLVFIEAMARRIPVIGLDIPPVVELISKSKSGVIYSQGQKSIVSCISSILDNYSKYSDNGYNYVLENLLWPKILSNICSYLS